MRKEKSGNSFCKWGGEEGLKGGERNRKKETSYMV